MRPAIARVLLLILNIPVWFGVIYGLAMPVAAVYFGKDGDEPLQTYTYIFLGMWAVFFVFHWTVKLGVMLLQFVFLGSTNGAELLVEAKLDRPEVQELLESGEYTRRSLSEELDAELKAARKASRWFGYGLLVTYFVIGLAVIFFMTR